MAKFPKTFALIDFKMGDSPHLFNTEDHQAYVGPFPDQHCYMPDGMSVYDRDAIIREGYVFEFRRDLVEYCKSEVLLLKQGCLTFKREFKAKARFHPFEQMTIALASNPLTASNPTPSPASLCSAGAIGVSTSRPRPSNGWPGKPISWPRPFACAQRG